MGACVAGDGAFKDADGTFLNARGGAGLGGFGIDVVLICEAAGEVGAREGDEVCVVEGLDAFHIGVVHLRAAVDRDFLKSHRPASFAAVDAGLCDRLIGGIDDMVAFCAEGGTRTDVRIEEPEWHVHRLYGFYTVVLRKC